MLGTSLSPNEPAELLSRLGFEAVPNGPSTYEVTVPTWRPDCEREVDLIEEIARIYGYENIARSLPRRPIAPAGLTDYQKGRRRVRELLAGAGANEAWTSSFLSGADLARAGLSSIGGPRPREPSRPGPRFAPHVVAPGPPGRRPLQHRAPGRRSQPLRDRERFPPSERRRPTGPLREPRGDRPSDGACQ